MFSIIIPLYNKQESIKHCLESVISQKFNRFEVIIINDGSTDKSLKRILELDDPRIKLFQQKNKGVSSARNIGIKNANYPYVAFLDADDYWEPNYLNEQAKMIEDFPEVSMWGLNWTYIIQNQKKIQKHKIADNYRGIVTDYWKNDLNLFWTSSVVVSKSVFCNIGYFDEKIRCGEDLDMWYRIILNYPVAFYNIPLSCYVLDAENRAMNKEIPLNTYLPYYIEKYRNNRNSNEEFCRYFDRECLYRLYPYVLKSKNNSEINRILNQIDFSKQKISFRIRFMFPKMYNWYLKCKINHCIDFAFKR